MAVQRDDGVATALNVLEQLHEEDPSIIRTQNHRWEIRGNVESLIGDFLVVIEEAVLVSAEVVLLDERMEVQYVVLGRLDLVCSLKAEIGDGCGNEWQRLVLPAQLDVVEEALERPGNQFVIMVGP